MAVEEIAGRTPAVPRPVGARPVAVERTRAKREREEEVLVWPDLVFIEFIAAVLFTLTFIVLSVFIDAPLLNRANPDITPNPSKAPWYFLNLQELLLHMDKAWAGVLIPTIALIFFAAIPYIDRSNEATGRMVRHQVLGAHDRVHCRLLALSSPGSWSCSTPASSRPSPAGSPA